MSEQKLDINLPGSLQPSLFLLTFRCLSGPDRARECYLNLSPCAVFLQDYLAWRPRNESRCWHTRPIIMDLYEKKKPTLLFNIIISQLRGSAQFSLYLELFHASEVLACGVKTEIKKAPLKDLSFHCVILLLCWKCVR